MSSKIEKAMFKRVMNDLFAFIKKYYPQNEHAESMRDLGILTGGDATASCEQTDPEKKFGEIITDVAAAYDYEAAVNPGENGAFIAVRPTEKANSPGDVRSFFRGLILSSGAQLFGICSINDEMSDGDSFTYDVSFEENGAEWSMRPEKLISTEINLLGSVSGKIRALQKRINSLEAAAAKKPRTEKSDAPELLKENQELKKDIIELKTLNSVLAEKNTGLAFELIDAEDQLNASRQSLEKLGKKSMEDISRASEEEEEIRRKNEELENRLRENETYLEISRKELRAKTEELELTKKKSEEYFILKETQGIEIINLKKQIRKDEESIRALNGEKEGLLDQIKQLENLNERLQEDFVSKRNNKLPSREEASPFGKETFAGKVMETARKYVGESAEFLVRKALERKSMTAEQMDTAGEAEKKAFTDEIVKGGRRLVETKEDLSSMKQELGRIMA